VLASRAGVPVDIDAGKKWLQDAATQGVKAAKTRLELLEAPSID
jgi:TPR repeat protein